MKEEHTKLTFNNSERVKVDGKLVTYIPDGYKYAKDGYGGNQHWFYIVPDDYSLDLDHIEAKPLSFGIVDLPVDISSTVNKDSIEGCKKFLIQNNALDPNVAIYDLICSEHCFFRGGLILMTIYTIKSMGLSLRKIRCTNSIHL